MQWRCSGECARSLIGVRHFLRNQVRRHMTDVVALAFFGLFTLQAVGTVAYLVLVVRLFSRLESRHRPVFEALGSPSLLLNNSISNNFKVLGWLWGKDYEGLGDPDTERLAETVRRLLLSLVVTFAILIATLFLLGMGLSSNSRWSGP